MSKPILELQDVTVAFGSLGEDLILRDVNIRIYPGETAVLVGLSGSGKTVLLKTLAGLYRPWRGHAFCFGKDWDSLSSIGKHDLAQKVGMQFQKGALFDDLSAIENVAYPLREHTQMSDDEIQIRALECLRAVDLERARDFQPHEMSGGMKQRLGIARAIALKPEILFLDDPTAGLDPVNSDNMADLILGLKNEIGATLVIVTHDLMRAFQFAGRIFFVGSRTVLETGSAEETKKSQDPRVQQFLSGRLSGPLTDGSEF
jgi:phospholipid/cholesterol/gamma-HCH transport system ATP-binding protein